MSDMIEGVSQVLDGFGYFGWSKENEERNAVGQTRLSEAVRS